MDWLPRKKGRQGKEKWFLFSGPTEVFLCKTVYHLFCVLYCCNGAYKTKMRLQLCCSLAFINRRTGKRRIQTAICIGNVICKILGCAKVQSFFARTFQSKGVDTFMVWLPLFQFKDPFQHLGERKLKCGSGEKASSSDFFSINYLSRQSAVALLKKLSNSLRSTTLSLMPFLVTLDQSEKWMTGPGAPLNVTDSNNRASEKSWTC